MMEFAYNNSQNASTGFFPFRLNYGHEPLIPSALLRPIRSNTPTATDFISKQQATLTQAAKTEPLYRTSGGGDLALYTL